MSTLGLPHSIRRSARDLKGPISSKRDLRGAKNERIKSTYVNRPAF